MNIKFSLLFMLSFFFAPVVFSAQNKLIENFFNTSENQNLNVHAGNIIKYKGVYYWYGENRSPTGPVKTGFSLYTSKNLSNWSSKGVVFNIKYNSKFNKDIQLGAIYERPKVIYNKKNNNFVMIFHFEKKGMGYKSALVGFAVSSAPTGPFVINGVSRLASNQLPVGISDINKVKGSRKFLRDFNVGQMSRDINVFVDDNSDAYIISSSEDNSTMIISKLNSDYTGLTNKFVRVAPGGYNEAPVLFKSKGVYYIISSGTSGWLPNKARLFVSNKIFGEWEFKGTPILSESENDINTTFHSQGAFILKHGGNVYLISDRWNQANLQDSSYAIFLLKWVSGLPFISN